VEQTLFQCTIEKAAVPVNQRRRNKGKRESKKRSGAESGMERDTESNLQLIRKKERRREEPKKGQRWKNGRLTHLCGVEGASEEALEKEGGTPPGVGGSVPCEEKGEKKGKQNKRRKVRNFEIEEKVKGLVPRAAGCYRHAKPLHSLRREGDKEAKLGSCTNHFHSCRKVWGPGTFSKKNWTEGERSTRKTEAN